MKTFTKWLLIAIGCVLLWECSDDTVVDPNGAPPGPLHKLVFNAHDTAEGHYKLFTIKDDGTELKEIFSNPTYIWDLSVSPNGDHLICVVDTSVSDAAYHQLFLVNVDGSGSRKITDWGSAVLEEPQWFPDGEEILFAFHGAARGQIYRIRTDGSGLTRITTDDDHSHRFPRLSPDGEKIAFEKRSPDRNTIWVINVDGTGEKMLSDPSAEYDDWHPEWSFDSEQIIYYSYFNYDTYIVDADGANRRLLCESGSYHHVSPVDGRIVVGGLTILDPDGSNVVHLTESYVGDTYPLLWSPDGVKIGFRGDVNRDGKDGICVVQADGSWLREITLPPEFELAQWGIRVFDWVP